MHNYFAAPTNAVANYALCIKNYALYFVEGLGEIVDDVVDMLRADAEADGRGRDMLLGKFLR